MAVGGQPAEHHVLLSDHVHLLQRGSFVVGEQADFLVGPFEEDGLPQLVAFPALEGEEVGVRP